MPEPALLILDEPTNALDPAGIHEIRGLIAALPREHGITVFLSSHLLGEVEQLATHLGIIQRGGLLFQGTLEERQARRKAHLVLGTNQPDLRNNLGENGWQVLPASNGLLHVAAEGPEDVARANRLLMQTGLDVTCLGLEQPSLEDTFLNLDAGETRMTYLLRALGA